MICCVSFQTNSHLKEIGLRGNPGFDSHISVSRDLDDHLAFCVARLHKCISACFSPTFSGIANNSGLDVHAKMTSAYGTCEVDLSSTGQQYAKQIPYIPLNGEIQGSQVTVDFVKTEEDVAKVRGLLNTAIEEGESWPFDIALSDRDFRSYFFTHTALVVRNEEAEVIGTFYCKPNFPGRCSHICNGGFITDPMYRGRGVATLMAKVFLRVARDLGFSAVLFNLVFERNIASVRLWNKMGFRRMATIPRAGRLRGGTSDAHQYYFDLQKGEHEGKTGVTGLRQFFSWATPKAPLMCSLVAAFLMGKSLFGRKL